jgi:hypothetical protein
MLDVATTHDSPPPPHPPPHPLTPLTARRQRVPPLPQPRELQQLCRHDEGDGAGGQQVRATGGWIWGGCMLFAAAAAKDMRVLASAQPHLPLSPSKTPRSPPHHLNPRAALTARRASPTPGAGAASSPAAAPRGRYGRSGGTFSATPCGGRGWWTSGTAPRCTQRCGFHAGAGNGLCSVTLFGGWAAITSAVWQMDGWVEGGAVAKQNAHLHTR